MTRATKLAASAKRDSFAGFRFQWSHSCLCEYPSLSSSLCVCCEFMARSKDNNNTSNEFLWAHTHPTLSYPLSAIRKINLLCRAPATAAKVPLSSTLSLFLELIT